MKSKSITICIGFLLLICLGVSTVSGEPLGIKINEKAIEVAKSYLHVRENNNNNRSIEIDKWHKEFGIPYGNPYCAMFSQYSYIEAFRNCHMRSPLPKMARVSTFSKWGTSNPMIVKTITPKQITFGAYRPEIGDIISWKHGKLTSTANKFNWDGHMGLVLDWNGKTLSTIEGNTKPEGSKGDQTGRAKEDPKLYGHDGVYERKRTLGQNTSFPIVYFFRLNKREL